MGRRMLTGAICSMEMGALDDIGAKIYFRRIMLLGNRLMFGGTQVADIKTTGLSWGILRVFGKYIKM